MRYINFAHTYRADSGDFAQGGLWGPEYQKSPDLGHFFVIFGPPKGKSSESALYVCKLIISKLVIIQGDPKNSKTRTLLEESFAFYF